MNLRRVFSSMLSFVLLGCVVAATTMAACSSQTNENNGDSSAGKTGSSAGGDSESTGGKGSGIDVGKGGTAGAAGISGCGETALVATRRPVNVLVLLDRSLSMTSAISSTDTTTRWAALRNALNTALTSVSDHVAFGL